MTSFLTWGGEHPWLFVFFVIIVAEVIVSTAKALRRAS
jgi:hypothetical protein